MPFGINGQACKITFCIGFFNDYNRIISTAKDIDKWTLSPKSGTAESFMRIIDVTFYSVRDSTSTYPVRVRELLYDKDSARHMVYTTHSVVALFNNNLSCSMFLAYQQADCSNMRRGGRQVNQG